MTIAHLLVDYAGVICTAQPAADMTEMAALAALPASVFEDRYWHFRPAYDRDCTAVEYWNRVVDQDHPIEPDLLQRLTTVDTASGSHLNPYVVATLSRAQAAGTRLTLLSNAPPELSTAVENTTSISSIFSMLLFSARLGPSKPGADIFAKALALTGTAATETLFVDDRSENIAAARALGFQTHHFTEAAQLAQRLRIS